MDIDNKISEMFKSKSEIDVPDNLVSDIMSNICSAGDSSDYAFLGNIRILTAASLVLFVFALSMFIKPSVEDTILVSYYSYSPSSYSENIVLTAENITKDSMYSMMIAN